MDEGGNTKDDLGLPKGTDDAEKLADQIKKDFDDGKELVVTVLKVGNLLPVAGAGAVTALLYIIVSVYAAILCTPLCSAKRSLGVSGLHVTCI